MDPIRYDPETFRSLRNASSAVVDMSQAIFKLDRLYATRACFVPTVQPAAATVVEEPSSHRHHHNRRHGGHGGRHVPRDRERHHAPPVRSALLKDDHRPRVERDIVATLNKVNGTNFDALRNHFLRAFAMDTDTCMQLLLDRCHLQVEYMPQYVGLVRYILDNTPECNRGFVRQRISDFVAGFIAGRCFSAVPPPQAGGEDYDDYCQWVRMKRTILGKHKTVLRLLSEGLAADAADMHSYFCSLISMLYDWRAAAAKENGEEDSGNGMETAEVLLDMLAEFFDAELRACADVVKYLREWRDAISDAHGDEELQHVLNAKCRFKLLNILESREKDSRESEKAVHLQRLRPGGGEQRRLLRGGGGSVGAPPSTPPSSRAVGVAKSTAASVRR